MKSNGEIYLTGQQVSELIRIWQSTEGEAIRLESTNVGDAVVIATTDSETLVATNGGTLPLIDQPAQARIQRTPKMGE